MVFYLFSLLFRQMCNTSMSVSADGAVSTSQIPASEQETLVGILLKGVTFKNIFTLWCDQLNYVDTSPNHSMTL